MARARLIEWRGERARLETHPAAPAGALAGAAPAGPEGVLTPLAYGHALSVDFVRRCVEEAVRTGHGTLTTTAMATEEADGFLQAGFRVRASLHLLVRDLTDLHDLPAARDVSLGKARWSDRHRVLAVDAAAFGPGWRLDEWGLESALAATPASRFRVAHGADGRIAGYAVTGRAGKRGYLQRLAVEPPAQGRGLGSALVVDALRWCRKRRVRRVAVNTQQGNETALALYRRLGFVDAPTMLCVVELPLDRASATPEPGA